ncbi:MAG: 3-deoxy-D-manno-octulosonic acid transferase [Pelagibacteraceae bacterium]
MFFLYSNLTKLFFPFLIILVTLRKYLGKEDPERFKEKIFSNSNKKIKNFKKELIWFHGASIGEISSVFCLINYLVKKNKRILITSTTLSSGKLIEDIYKNNSNIIHLYFPFDVPFLVKKFLKKWKPKSIIFIDSEIWPNFLSEIKKRKLPLALLNARITKKTMNRWKLFLSFAKENFSSFNICLASSKESAKNLKVLGAKNIKFIGNLKYCLDVENKHKISSDNLKIIKNKDTWCCASTHDGEEILCVKTHKQLKKKNKKILTIIIPRHLNRNQDIYNYCKNEGLNIQIINKNEKINVKTEVLLINSFGSLSKYYRVCKSVFIGKSLLKKLILVGGQNPIEPAKYGCKIYHGPFVYNFQEVYDYLKKINVAIQIRDVNELTKNLKSDFNNKKKINSYSARKINLYGKMVLKKTIKELKRSIV